MFAVTQNHHCQSHWFVNNIVIHCRWIMAHLVHSGCIFLDSQGASVVVLFFFCSLSFLLLLLLNLPLSTHPPSHTTHTNTHSSLSVWNNKRKALCLVQLLNSCLVCVSWGGCTSVAGPSIRPMHSPQTSRYRDDKYPISWKGHGKRWMVMERERQLQISKWSDSIKGEKWGQIQDEKNWRTTKTKPETEAPALCKLKLSCVIT